MRKPKVQATSCYLQTRVELFNILSVEDTVFIAILYDYYHNSQFLWQEKHDDWEHSIEWFYYSSKYVKRYYGVSITRQIHLLEMLEEHGLIRSRRVGDYDKLKICIMHDRSDELLKIGRRIS